MTVQNSLVNWPIMSAGNEEQKRKYLPKLASGEWLGCYGLSEPAVGSDPAGMACTATQDGDYWVINGSKNLISNGGVADVAVIWATTDRSIRHKAVATFIVERGTAGFSAGKSEHKLGIHGSNTVMLYFENCRIPNTQLLAPPSEGFKLAMKTLDGGRIGVAAQAVGIAQAALDYAANYAHQRTAFGKPIADLQAIQFKIADMATRTTAARLLTLQAADFKQRGLPYSEQAAMAKLFATETATFVTHQAVQILGGYGYLREYPVERLYRDARITEIYEGTSEIQRLVIAGQELKARKPAAD
jgi:acyl-CoA dehydrogenase